jgi:acetyl esterase/lipase
VRPHLSIPPQAGVPATVLVAMALLVAARPCPGQEPPAPAPTLSDLATHVEENVVYGMVSGGALLMDVHWPARSNGGGILFVAGSGWHSGTDYGATPLKGRSARGWSEPLAPLTGAGFTVFVLNHRAAPGFRHPDALHDVQRAVRYIRAHAARWGIDRDRIGAIGHSSGGHLVSLLGTMQAEGEPAARDPADRESARVRAVVAAAAPIDLRGLHVHYADQRADRDEDWLATAIFGAQTVGAYLGQRCMGRGDDQRICIEASPLTHISGDAAAFLLVHGERDFLVPISHSIMLRDSLRARGGDVQLLAIPDGGHGAFPLPRFVPWLADRLGGGGAADAAVGAAVPAAVPGPSPERLEPNVVYGMVSGLALLMDVHFPERANGRAVLFISGTGWHAPSSYGASQLKGDPPLGHADWLKPLTDAGYTVFAINHRAAPRFRWPAALEDAQRAVRYIRHNAARWQVDPERIGAVGGSSGGHLVSLLGTLDLAGNPEAVDPVERESAKVQTVVAIAAPTIMTEFDTPFAVAHVASFVGSPPGGAEGGRYLEASAATHVSADDAPFLLIHGDVDDVVPFRQSEMMLDALLRAGVAAELVRRAGRGHERIGLEGAVGWLDEHLLGARATAVDR